MGRQEQSLSLLMGDAKAVAANEAQRTRLKEIFILSVVFVVFENGLS